jgi:integrase
MPKKTLTAASVERMKAPKSGQVEYFDQGYPGLSLRVSYGGRKAWSLFYRLNGKLSRVSLGIYPSTSLAEAREAWRETRKQVAAGIDPSQAKGAARLSTGFSEVVREWLVRDQAGNKSAAAIARLMETTFIPLWGTRPITEITRRDVRDVIDGIADRGTVIRARRIHAALHRLFAWAVSRDIITANPMTGLGKPGSETSRDRVLSDDELRQVWKAAENLGYPFGPAHQLLVLTGARREEIGQLRWSEIENDTIRLEGSRTKNGAPHDIPLSAPATALLYSLPRIGEFVFAIDENRPVSAWSKAKAKLDVIAPIAPSWRVHDLRRVCATGLQRLGVNLQVVESVLGHTAGSRTGIIGVYQRHSYADEKRMALEAWGAHIMRLIEGTGGAVVVPLTRAS